MRSFQERIGELDARRVRVVGVSVDPPETNQELRRSQGYTFTLLSDPRAEVIRLYDLVHEGAGPEGSDIARPAEFLVDSTGTVRWANLTGSYMVRATPDQVLRAVDVPGHDRTPP